MSEDKERIIEQTIDKPHVTYAAIWMCLTVITCFCVYFSLEYGKSIKNLEKEVIQLEKEKIKMQIDLVKIQDEIVITIDKDEELSE